MRFGARVEAVREVRRGCEVFHRNRRGRLAKEVLLDFDKQHAGQLGLFVLKSVSLEFSLSFLKIAQMCNFLFRFFVNHKP